MSLIMSRSTSRAVHNSSNMLLNRFVFATSLHAAARVELERMFPPRSAKTARTGVGGEREKRRRNKSACQMSASKHSPQSGSILPTQHHLHCSPAAAQRSLFTTTMPRDRTAPSARLAIRRSPLRYRSRPDRVIIPSKCK